MVTEAVFIWSTQLNYYYCELLLFFILNNFYFYIFENVFNSCDGKTEFSASLLKFSVPHYSSEII